MKRYRTEEKINSTKNIHKAIKLFAIIFVAVFILEIWMANRLSTDGNKINQIKVAQNSLRLENQELENEIAQKSSLLAIEKSSTRLGFSSIRNVEYYRPANIAAVY